MKCVDIGIVMTCFNRKEMTLRCIEQLSKRNMRYRATIYVCDDASTDGTPEEIKKRFPDVILLKGSGTLYWCRGMYNAMKEAVSHKHSLYLMVNDDVDFFENAVEEMINTFSLVNSPCGIVGYTISKKDGSITYGGSQGVYMTLFGKNAGFKGDYKVHSTERELVTCLLTNWNCFLIDAFTIEKIGLIDPIYEHGIGDYDYSLMMNKAGIPVYVTKNPIGYCERNKVKNTFQDDEVKRFDRFIMLFSPKAYPIKSRFHYHIKHWGIVGAVYVCLIYVNFIFKIILGKEIK